VNRKVDYNFFSALFFIIFAILIGIQSIKIGLGTINEPGPGFLPMFSAAAIGVLACILLTMKISEKSEWKLGQHWKRAFWIMVVSFIYGAILWTKLGYIVGTFIWLIAVLRIAGIQSLKKNLLITGVVVVFSYILFEKIGKVILPKGIFGF
jgi:hypothetical protein